MVNSVYVVNTCLCVLKVSSNPSENANNSSEHKLADLTNQVHNK